MNTPDEYAAELAEMQEQIQLEKLEATPPTLPARPVALPIERHAHILTIARNLLARDGGWCKNAFKTLKATATGHHVESYCILGGIQEALILAGYFSHRDHYWIHSSLREAVRRAIQQHTGNWFFDLAGWNDEPERTQADIVEALDWTIRAVDEADAKGLPSDLYRAAA